MKKIKYLIITGILPVFVPEQIVGQNLILNPSFEDYYSCPYQISTPDTAYFVDSIMNWYTPSQGTSDYFHTCAADTAVDIPSNGMGNEPAYHGNAYAGIMSCAFEGTCSSGSATPYKEYIAGTFSVALTAGQEYRFTAHISCADNLWCSTDMGVYFTSTKVFFPDCEEINATPQIDFGTITPSKTGWTKYSGNFTASGGELYCIIGSFSGVCPASLTYYYIDSVSLSPVTPSPVTLVKFSGKCLGNQNLLEWTTAMEVNNDYYIIEKSTDSEIFKQIGIVNGSGSVNSERNYTFLDNVPARGTSYYRLKQVDFNGDFEYSKAISVHVSPTAEAITLAYNPYHESLVIYGLESLSGSAQLQINDPAGRIIWDKTITPHEEPFELNCSGLPSGMYIISIADNKNRVANSFVKW